MSTDGIMTDVTNVQEAEKMSDVSVATQACLEVLPSTGVEEVDKVGTECGPLVLLWCLLFPLILLRLSLEVFGRRLF